MARVHHVRRRNTQAQQCSEYGGKEQASCCGAGGEGCMTRICFIDTETQSLRPDRRAWEVGLIVREPGRPDVEHWWLIDGRDLDLGNADPASLRIGRFYERHPHYRLDRESTGTDTDSEYDVLRLVEVITRGAHLVGAVPNFDADVLGARMRANGICPSWNYHL